MKYIKVSFYEDNEQPYFQSKDFTYEFTSENNTLYYKISEPFIWKNKLITGFFKGSNGIGWVNGILQLNQHRNFPVSDKQLKEFNKVVNMIKS